MRLTNIGRSHHPGTRAISRIRADVSIVLVTVAFALIFALDHVTGAAPVQHLYYLPIAYVAFRFGIRPGIGGALVAIALYHIANPHLITLGVLESDPLQIAVFIGVAIVTAQQATDARRLHHLAMTDDLTGLHNLRSFELRLKSMVHAARRDHTPLSLMVLDVDRLKLLNDRHGHLTGAAAVQTVGYLIATGVTEDAAACRYGGDEFVIALPRTDAAQAVGTAEHLRRTVHSVAPVLARVQFPAGTLSISVGLASQTFARGDMPTATLPDDEVGETLFRAADAALYAAKNGGRNRVHGA